MGRKPKTIPTMDGNSYLKLASDITAFLDATRLIEKRIRSLNVEHSNQNLIGGSTGWKIHDIWESLKTASHFNFGIAFELRLKCILKLCGPVEQSSKAVHSLEKIYSLIPSQICRELEDLFVQETRNKSFHLLAFVRSKSKPTDTPPNRSLKDLRDFCIYFDKDVKLWMKRYSWEELSNQKWVHYIEDLSPLISFVEKAAGIGERLAYKAKIIKSPDK